MKPEYEEFLNEQGFDVTFPKENARILWNCKEGKLVDLVVEDFSDPQSKHHLYKKYSFDVGNCLSDWEDWEFSDVLIKIFISYEVPLNMRIKILFQLSKVHEWREAVAFWLWRNAN